MNLNMNSTGEQRVRKHALKKKIAKAGGDVKDFLESLSSPMLASFLDAIDPEYPHDLNQINRMCFHLETAKKWF